MFDTAINIVLVLAILVLLVVVHEFGHFIVARSRNVRVHEFGIGFPPRALTFGHWGETAITLNWLPIGGFVRLEGEEGQSDDARAFVNQKLRTRLAILFAGVAMNLLLAWLIFTLIAAFADPVYSPRLDTVQPGSPAAAAGLVGSRETGKDAQGNPIYDNSGDVILAINGQHFPLFDNMGIGPGQAQRAYLTSHAGQTVTLAVQHADGSVETKTATLRSPEQLTQGALGVTWTAVENTSIQQGPIDAIVTGLHRTIDASTLILRGLGQLVTNITNPPVAGPVGIVSAVGQVRSELPPVFMIWLIGLLSANLAVVNLLPLPPMDGGRIAVSVIQAASGNRISPSLERAIYFAGFVALMAFLAWITIFDFQRMAGG